MYFFLPIIGASFFTHHFCQMKYWIGVASRDHCYKAVALGIAQVCHGKGGPLKKMRRGDGFLYYAPRQVFMQKEPCRKFVAMGQAAFILSASR